MAVERKEATTTNDEQIYQYVERFGQYFEQMGASRSAGQVLAWLLLSESPQSLDDLARSLHISKASASFATRMWEQVGFVTRVRVRGDRKTYYQVQSDIVSTLTGAAIAKMQAFADLFDEGQKVLGDARPRARAVLRKFSRVYRHMARRLPEVLAEVVEE